MTKQKPQRASKARQTKTGAIKKLQPKTENQRLFVEALRADGVTMVVGTGPSGTGKTFCTAAIAAELFSDNIIDKIVLTRPSVGVDEEHGFLPGNLGEKFEPWAAPFVNVLRDLLGADVYQRAVANKEIEVVPLGMLRGRSFDNALVMLDEAQNSTYRQMKMLLTRIGENSKVVVSGDLDQKDIDEAGGLDAVHAILKIRSTKAVAHVEFDDSDIVRSEFCQWWVRAFNKYEGR